MKGSDVILLIANGLYNKKEETVLSINDLIATLLDENIKSEFANELAQALQDWCNENNCCPLCGKEIKTKGDVKICECGYKEELKC